MDFHARPLDLFDAVASRLDENADRSSLGNRGFVTCPALALGTEHLIATHQAHLNRRMISARR
jgi:hypothetical protein